MSLFSSLIASLPRGLSRVPVKGEGIIPRSLNTPTSPKLFPPSDNAFPVGPQKTLLSPVSPSFSGQNSPTKDSWVSVDDTQGDILMEGTTGDSITRKRFILEPPPKRI